MSLSRIKVGEMRGELHSYVVFLGGTDVAAVIRHAGHRVPRIRNLDGTLRQWALNGKRCTPKTRITQKDSVLILAPAVKLGACGRCRACRARKRSRL